MMVAVWIESLIKTRIIEHPSSVRLDLYVIEQIRQYLLRTDEMSRKTLETGTIAVLQAANRWFIGFSKELELAICATESFANVPIANRLKGTLPGFNYHAETCALSEYSRSNYVIPSIQGYMVVNRQPCGIGRAACIIRNTSPYDGNIRVGVIASSMSSLRMLFPATLGTSRFAEIPIEILGKR